MRHLAVLAAVVALAVAVPQERTQALPARYARCRGSKGVCVPYYLCKDDEVITDGAGLIDIRIGGPEACPNFLDICCINPHPIDTTPPPPPVYQSTCGVRNTQGIDVRIQGFKGNETQVAEFPWMTAVLKKEVVSNEEINLYLCGGTLIHPRIVMTAAHCINDHQHSGLRVRLGEWDTQNEYEPYKHQDRDVQKVVIHEGFNPINLHNDYALLYLSTPAELSKNVDVLCLYDKPDFFNDIHSCVVTGWGKDRFGKKGVFQNVLKKIDLPYVHYGQCEKALKTTRLGEFFVLDQSFICAGGEAGKDSCSGDGGSPLMCLSGAGTQYVQVGMVAWGIGCGTAGIPAVYVDIIGGYYWIFAEANKLLAPASIDEYWQFF